MGRLKRNNYQRFGGLYDWWGRDPDVTGENIEHQNIPTGTQLINSGEIYKLAREDNTYDKLLEQYNDYTGKNAKFLPKWQLGTNWSKAEKNNRQSTTLE